MISFWTEITINSWIATGKPKPQIIPPLGGSGITAGLFWGAVWDVCGGQVIFQAGCLPWDCVLQRESDLRGRQANSRAFLFSQGRGKVRRIFFPHCLKMNGGFAAMRQ